MKKLIGISLMFLSLIILSVTIMFSCTPNQRVKVFGGTETINLSENTKLVNVTWKGVDLWILTKEAKQGDVSETYKFCEKSNYGIIEGSIIIKENISLPEINKQVTKDDSAELKTEYDINKTSPPNK